jgi:hypothetical protein
VARVSDGELLGQRAKPKVSSPEFVLADHRRGEQVDVYPCHASSMQTTILHECDDLFMRNWRSLMHLNIGVEELSTAASGADKQLSKNQFMACDLVPTQKSIQFRSVGFAIGEESNPHRGVDQDH